jgi:hypothetical protein
VAAEEVVVVAAAMAAAASPQVRGDFSRGFRISPTFVGGAGEGGAGREVGRGDGEGQDEGAARRTDSHDEHLAKLGPPRRGVRAHHAVNERNVEPLDERS